MEESTPNQSDQRPASPSLPLSTKPAQQSALLQRVLNQFISSIEGLATSFPVTTAAIREEMDECSQGFRSFLEEHATRMEKADPINGKPAIIFAIHSDYAEEAERLRRNMRRVRTALSLVPRSLFVSLVSAYDHFLGDLIRALLVIKPEVLNASEKTMRFSDLMQFSSVVAARNFIIEKEVETVLRDSHSDHFDWMESRFGLPLRKGLDVWPDFIEITERRNLFVHAGGVVSGQYLEVCTKNKSDIEGVSRGEQLQVPAEYFDRSYEVLFEIGVKLTHVLWRKLVEKERQRADQNLLDITYRLISEERYKLAIVLLDFAVDVLPKHYSEDYRLRFLFNRAQAYKWSGDEDQAIAKIEKEDLSAAKPVFKLAAACIRDDVPSAITSIKEIGVNGEIGLSELRQWPIFKKLREDNEFSAIVGQVFGEALIRRDLDAEVPVVIETHEKDNGLSSSIEASSELPSAGEQSDLSAYDA